MDSLVESYNSTVATSNVDEMCKTLLRWLDQNCCLITLRRGTDSSRLFTFSYFDFKIFTN